MKPERLTGILLGLELEGLIRQLPGKRFARLLHPPNAPGT